MRLFATLALLVALSSCVSVNWQRDTRFERPPRAALASLNAGEWDLSRCLDALGAPLYVWEHDGEGLALAYGWYESDQRGFAVRFAVGENGSASFNYDRIDAEMHGRVLFFDEARHLVLVRRGRLRAITADLQRKRPALIDDQPR